MVNLDIKKTSLNPPVIQSFLEQEVANINQECKYPTYGLENLGLKNLGCVYRNLSIPQLVECAIVRGEGKLASNGALVVETGKYTGRSPKDRYIVDEPSSRDEIDWNNLNVPISEENFERL